MTSKPTQQTQPQGKDARGEPAKPIVIPVPKRDDFDKLVTRAVRRAVSTPHADDSE